jgi:hypothetical protein
MRKSLGTLMDYCSLPHDMGLAQVSELKDEGVPEDPHGLLNPFPDLGLTQVSELKMRKSLTLMDCSTPSQIWVSPR